jgi:hypothetical protein
LICQAQLGEEKPDEQRSHGDGGGYGIKLNGR